MFSFSSNRPAFEAPGIEQDLLRRTSSKERARDPIASVVRRIALLSWFTIVGGLSPNATGGDADVPALKTLHDHFPMSVPDSVEDWELRASQLRLRVAIATGLHPMPTRGPIHAEVRDPIQRSGFQFSKVAFESLPGHFVTGLLFEPTGANRPSGKLPGILCPHGHGGRMQRHDRETIQSLIESGDERFVASGSTPKLARCAALARLGCVVFIPDMLGYGDSVQIGFDVAHRHHRLRGGEHVPAGQAPIQFFSTPADARLLSIMGLQTFNAIRSIDFLCTLANVDPHRLAVTGGSGGGTQSILLAALDDRVRVSFPNGMVSTSMQGGCPCENACHLRVGTGNVELAALMAPRPMAMTAADDWTRDMMRDGYPQLSRLYGMFQEPSNVACQPLLQFKHNYNFVTRGVMLSWMNRHLGLGHDEPVTEVDFDSIRDAEATVWDDDHPPPTNVGLAHERDVLSWWTRQSEQGMSGALGSGATAESFDQWIRPALRTLYSVDEVSSPVKSPSSDVKLRTWEPKRVKHGATVLWLDAVDSITKDRDWTPSRFPAELQPLINAGHRIVRMPLTYDGEPWSQSRRQAMNVQPSHSVAMTFGYNMPAAVVACHTVLKQIKRIDATRRGGIILVAPSHAAVVALPVAAIAGSTVVDAMIGTHGDRTANLNYADDVRFVPGAIKYGDMDAWAAMRAPHRLTLIGETVQSMPTASSIYRDRGAADELTFRAISPR
ncbi:MAG: acetylxylan esterase [Planctomycetota bacterium]